MKNLILLAVAIFVKCAQAELPPRAIYMVPTPPRLSEFATLAIDDLNYVEEQLDSGKITLRYSLPLALTGVKNEIELSGNFDSNGNAHFLGEKSEAFCIKSSKTTSCSVRFKNLEFDSEKIRELLELSEIGPDTIAKRLEVAERFQSDPIGVLYYDFKH